MSHFFRTSQACEGRALPSMDLASRKVSKLLIRCHHHFQRLQYEGTSYKTGPMTKYMIFNIYKSFFWLTNVRKLRNTKKFVQYPLCPKQADDLLHYKKTDRIVLLSHFLANQIARKPVCISCHIIMLLV